MEFESISRISSDALNEILGQPFSVLNDGFVRVMDYMGSDASIVQAARVSYGRGTKKVSEDEGLIKYLMRNRHTTPFEMCELKLHVRVPMDVWRQWIRHRTVSVNEYSTRYSVAIDSKTKAERWRLQNPSNKQGSSGFVTEIPPEFQDQIDDMTAQEYLSQQEEMVHSMCETVYQNRLTFGVAREQARKDLPLSTYTEAYWKINLHNLLHFLSLRMDSHAQQEIRAYANIIGNEIVSKWVPLTWKAFQNYRMNSVTFSDSELSILKYLCQSETVNALSQARNLGWLKRSKKHNRLISNRERAEFEAKLKTLNITTPW